MSAWAAARYRRRSRDEEPSTALREEKRLGDLAIKIFEHFLPLFVGTYSAAPYRIDFAQFHPELLLAFLPHELDFTHLRLMWREWKEKAKLKVLGRPATPYGPVWLDNTISGIFRLRGDLVPDYRLLNYPVAWLATEHASALDGEPGNIARLAAELDQLGIVDRRMSFYMPLRLRQIQDAGYSGFEARYYSLFPSYDRDMAPATDLQQLLLAAAYQMALQGAVGHEQIPDDPTSESERRQPFFFSAAGLPAFYVHKRTRNELLAPHPAPLQAHALKLAPSRLSASLHQRLPSRLAGISRGRGHRDLAGLRRHAAAGRPALAAGGQEQARLRAIDCRHPEAPVANATPCGSTQPNSIAPPRSTTAIKCGTRSSPRR